MSANNHPTVIPTKHDFTYHVSGTDRVFKTFSAAKEYARINGGIAYMRPKH